MKRTVLLSAISGLMLCLAVGGCTKFSRARYESIHTGMNKLAVEKILGPPAAKFSDSWTYTPDEIEHDFSPAAVAITQKKILETTQAAEDFCKTLYPT
jgi:hypothetical protein